MMDRRQHPPVPTRREVVPGAGVNIVLKADQPTGRTVQGIIAHVLTRGNHPRGIKVRLADGRVGRVQSMSPTAAASAAGQPNDSTSLAGHASGSRPIRGHMRDGGGDIRYAEDQELPPQQIGLDAYVKEKKPKKHRRGKDRSTSGATTAGLDLPDRDSAICSPAQPKSATCPVCGEFEGDEAAVAHHVATHFDEATT